MASDIPPKIDHCWNPKGSELGNPVIFFSSSQFVGGVLALLQNFNTWHPKNTTILGFVGKEKMCQIFACYYPTIPNGDLVPGPRKKGTRFVFFYTTATSVQRLNSAIFHSTPSDWKIPSKASIRVNFFFASWPAMDSLQRQPSLRKIPLQCWWVS